MDRPVYKENPGGMNDRQPLATLNIPVLWGDLDALGHVNNTRFFGYIEELRIVWFNSLGSGWMADGHNPIVANINCNFRRPIHWPATVSVDLCASWAGGKSITLSHEIRDADNPATLYADATVVLVWVDQQTGQATALPAEVVRQIEALDGSAT